MSLSVNQKKAVTIERFQYESPNGSIEGWGVIPQIDSPCPVIIFCRGGTRYTGAIDEPLAINLMLPFALAGFAIFGSQYSGGPNSAGKDEYGGKDVLDIFSLVESLKKSQWNLDFSKTGLFGISRGAMMGMEVLRDGLEVKRAAFLSGLYDYQQIKEERPDMYEMWVNDKMFDPTIQTEIQKRSAVTFADKLPEIPYLLLHSQEDSRVPIRQARDMKKVLADNAELIEYDGDDHALRKVARKRNKRLVDWFLKM